MTPSTNYKLSRSDAAALWFFIAVGAVISVWVTVLAIARIVEVLPNTDVTVMGWFADTEGTAPIGPGGSDVAVQLDRAVLTVPTLQPAALWAIVIQQVILVFAVIIVTGALIWLTHNFIRGTFFSRRNTVLVATAGVVGFVGYTAVPFFGNMAANGAFARLSDYSFDNVIMTVEPFSMVVIAFLIALVGTVFSIGERLQRDTEGLV